MSRRRVSCRELGKPDCDGWLWKKRKESSVFIAQKWQRFWFVLKGPALYWYSSQQVGLSVSLTFNDHDSPSLLNQLFFAGWEGRGLCQYIQLQHRECWRTQEEIVRRIFVVRFYSRLWFKLMTKYIKTCSLFCRKKLYYPMNGGLLNLIGFALWKNLMITLRIKLQSKINHLQCFIICFFSCRLFFNSCCGLFFSHQCF